MEIVALAGGVGASKLLLGLSRAMNPADLTIIVNTGDDIVLHGLRISPDLDIVTYTLAGEVNPETGWGFREETFRTLEQLARYGRPDWFHLGDRDLATHLHRTALLAEGKTLSEAADSIRRAFRVPSKILPMSDQFVPTMIETDTGRMHFQEYLIEKRAQPEVRGILLEGVESACPAPGVLDSIREARGIILCPSNPLISIGPILAVPGVRKALKARRDDVIAVCPIVGGKSLKGPSDRMLAELGFDVSAAGVARMCRDICGTFVIDFVDAEQCGAIEALGMKVKICATVMNTAEEKEALARQVLEHFAPRAAGAGA